MYDGKSNELDRVIRAHEMEGSWLDYHQFTSVGQALRQLMNYVEFGEDNDGQIVIYTNLMFDKDEKILDMDTLESV